MIDKPISFSKKKTYLNSMGHEVTYVGLEGEYYVFQYAKVDTYVEYLTREPEEMKEKDKKWWDLSYTVLCWATYSLSML